MKLSVIIFFFFISTFLISGQVSFEQGYVVKNNGDKISCFIKDVESLKTPTHFEYKINLSDKETITGDVQSIKEFGIQEKFKYKRQKVEIDTENYRVTTLRNPVFETKTVFTKVLVEGHASLYSNFEGEGRSYFYTIEGQESDTPKTLIYKEFITSNKQFSKNENYKQELMNHLKCENLTQNDFFNLEYFESSLLKLFVKYNTCKGSDYSIYENKRKGKLNLKVAPRVAFNSLSTGRKADNRLDADFGDKTQFNFGLELEYIMSFNKNKWSVFINPTYQYFKEENMMIDYNNVSVSINYSSIELPIGVRHYMFLSDNSKFFVNAAFIPDLLLKNEYEYTLISGGKVSLKSAPNFAFGIGYSLNNKFDIEFRLNTNRKLFSGNIYYSNYNSSFIILRYNLL